MTLPVKKAIPKKIRSGPQRSLRAALAMSTLILAGGVWWCLAGMDACTPTAFLLTADQQGRQHYQQGDYTASAQLFINPEWRAAALYRAGAFKAAGGLYAGMATAEAAYNYGNTLVMLGQYQEAVDQYDRALSLRPGWQAAVANRSIATMRTERLKQTGGDSTGGMLGADEISFEKGKASTEQTEDITGPQVQSEAEMRAIWLRQVQTQPADFLKAKFAYQAAMKKKTP